MLSFFFFGILFFFFFLITIAVVLLQMDKENNTRNLKHTFYNILGDFGFGYSLYEVEGGTL